MTTATGSVSGTAGPVTLIADPLLLERWLRALSELASAPPGAAPSQAWPTYAGNAKAQLGTGMFNFTLGGFEPGTTAGDDTDQGGAAAPGDETDSDGDSHRAGDRDLTESARRRVRRDLEAAVRTTMPGLPAFHRVAILGLVLYAAQAQVWDSALGDQGWFPVAGDALGNIDKDDIPEQLSGSAASWTATAVYLMHEHRPTTGRPAETVLYEKVAADVSHLFADADPELIASIAAPFTNRNGYPIDPSAVMELISMLVQDDPLAEAIDILSANHPAWHVHKHNDRMIHVRGEFRATFLPAVEALDAIPGTGIAAAWATGVTPGWTIAIRDDESLIRIDKNPNGQVTWWHYRTGHLTSPTGIARDPEIGNRARIRHGALNQPFPSAIEAMTAVGADPTVDPPLQCPPDSA